MADDLVSISAYARETGVSKQAIAKAVGKFGDRGLVETRQVGRQVMFSRSAFERAKAGAGDPARELAVDMARQQKVEEPEQELSAPTLPTAGSPAPAPTPVEDPYRRAAAVEKTIKAKRAQIELGELEGSLVRRDEVVAGELNVSRAVRNAVLAACGKAADRIAALPDGTDTRAVKAVLQTTMTAALAVMADAMPNWKGAEEAAAGDA